MTQTCARSGENPLRKTKNWAVLFKGSNPEREERVHRGWDALEKKGIFVTASVTEVCCFKLKCNLGDLVCSFPS